MMSVDEKKQVDTNIDDNIVVEGDSVNNSESNQVRLCHFINWYI